MTKDDFAAKLAGKTDLSKAKAREIIDCIFGTDSGDGIIAAELDAGRDFPVTGFGRFGTRDMKSRTGRNPRSGDRIWIEAKTIPTFKAGQGLKNRVSDLMEAVPMATAQAERMPTAMAQPDPMPMASDPTPMAQPDPVPIHRPEAPEPPRRTLW